MTHTRRLLTITVATLLSVACGADHMQNDDVRALGGSIDSARLEVVRHQDAVTNADTLTALPAEIDRHDHNMGDIMDTMDTRMGGMMSHCSGPGMGTMHDRMDGIASEMRSHREAMTGAATLADAQSECTLHTHRMNGMLDAMNQSLSTVGCSMMGL